MKRTGILFSLFLTCMTLYAASMRPLLFCYSSYDYGTDAGLQNWDMTQATTGEIFVANNSCVLRYDGTRWQTIGVGRFGTVRSVLAVGQRIYLGMFKDFGYLENDGLGGYSFTSIAEQGLSNGLPAMENDEEIWQIVSLEDAVYFLSFSHLYEYRNNTLSRLDTHHTMMSLFAINNQLLLQTMGHDFYRINNMSADGMELLFKREETGGEDVLGIVALNDALLLSTPHALYLYQDRRIKPFRSDIERLHKDILINKLCLTGDGNIVIGTINNGIICIRPDGSLLWHYNTESGLRNDCVQRLMTDWSNNVWACLDDGIAMIAQGAPFRVIGSGSFGRSIGMVYGVCVFDKQLWMATNQGLYAAVLAGEGAAQLQDGTEGQNWHVSDINGTLFVGNNSAPLRWQDNRFERVPRTSASSTCMKPFSLQGKDFIIEASYYHLRLYRAANNQWLEPEVISGFHHPVRQLEWDTDGSLWASDMNRGVYHLRLTPDLSRVMEVDYFPTLDSIRSRCFIMAFDGQVLFSNGRALYTFQTDTRSFLPFTPLNQILTSDATVLNIVPSHQGMYWICTDKGYTLIRRSGEGWAVQASILSEKIGYRNNDVSASVYEYNGISFFNMADAVMAYMPSFVPDTIHTPFFLHAASFLDKNGYNIPLSVNEVLSGKAKVNGTVRLLFSYPQFVNSDVRFRFTVAGRDGFTWLKDIPEIDMPQRAFGHVNVLAEAIKPDGSVLAAQHVAFTVLRPWFIRWWALIIWTALLALFCIQIVHLVTKRKIAAQRLRILEQEQIIAEQKQQLLEKQLDDKSKDLASLSFDAALKNNVLNSLKDAIKLQQKQGNISHGALNSELLRLKQTADDNKNWDVFKQNFDRIHEHFFRHLKEQFPALTNADLRLCAMLRLNWSTKEIANYSGVSIRGVESARFRLRKKLNLAPNQNLTDFLITFK